MFDNRYWLWLSLIFEPGSTLCDSLLYAFGNDPKKIYEADEAALSPFVGDNFRIKAALLDKRPDRSYAIMEFCQRENVGILTPDSKLYPSSLMRINGRPPVLYYKGKLPDFSGKLFISVVGTRSVSPYGTSAAYTISHDLASAGAVVVSGMALGSDTAAHRGALDASGHTVAFLGCGIDVVYPKENDNLMKEIIATGTVMTDYPPGSRPEGRHFPQRNRLISGVSSGVLVTEASEKSGALITAEHARRQGKLIYAIPGKVGELTSLGTNKLISEGAKMVTRASDIIGDFTEVFPYLRFPPIPDSYTARPAIRKPANQPLPQKKEEKSTGEPMSRIIAAAVPITVDIPENQMPEYSRASETQEPEDEATKPAPAVLRAAQPRPRLLFGEEEEARSYLSMDDNPAAPMLPENPLGDAVLFKYPNGPVPEDGFEINLTAEAKERFDDLTETVQKRRFGAVSSFRPVTGVPDGADNGASGKREPDIRKEARRTPDYSGLSETEKTILAFIYENGKSTVDGMSRLGLPVSKLLSALTMLEIKKRVIQSAGGFFEAVTVSR